VTSKFEWKNLPNEDYFLCKDEVIKEQNNNYCFERVGMFQHALSMRKMFVQVLTILYFCRILVFNGLFY